MKALENLYRNQAPAMRATLVRLLGSFELAEEALQMGFVAAAQSWPRDGVPRNPASWLISAGRFRLIDGLRRQKRLSELEPEIVRSLQPDEDPMEESAELPDDMLRLIFACCHPALAADAHAALCLREVCGLTTEAIAAAYFTATATMAQRIVRAKQKIRQARLPYHVPEGDALLQRLDSVLRVIYLIFNEGYASSAPDKSLRPDLAEEAIRLARLLTQLLPSADGDGLLGLMLLQHSRLAARRDAEGAFVPLSQQDRSHWDRTLIAEGAALIRAAWVQPPVSTYTLQGAIALVHSEAVDSGMIDWARIVALYDLLAIADPGPAVALSRAIAIGMRDGPRAGLAQIETLRNEAPDGQRAILDLARADFLWQLGDPAAGQAYRALSNAALSEAERIFVARRLEALTGP